MSPVHQYNVDIFHNLVFKKYWVLSGNRIPLKPLLGDLRIFAPPIKSHEQTQ